MTSKQLTAEVPQDYFDRVEHVADAQPLWFADTWQGEPSELAHVRYRHMRTKGVARGTIVLLHGVSMTCDVWSSYMVRSSETSSASFDDLPVFARAGGLGRRLLRLLGWSSNCFELF